MRHRTSILFGLLCLSVSCEQETAVINSDTPACDVCAVGIEEVAELGSSRGPDALGLWPVVARDSQGRFLLSDESNDASLLVFDSTGTFVTRIGRRGEGPGEYEFIRFVKADAEHVYVFDDRRRRMTVLDTAFTIVRTIPLTVPLLYSVTILPDGSPVLATNVATRAGAGFPLHLLDDRGQVTASFGGDEEGFRPDFLNQWSRVVSSAGDGSVWATAQNDYVLEQWEPNGRMSRRIVRRPGWFDPPPLGTAPAPDRPPSSRVFDLQLDADGYLWTLTGVAAGDWIQGVRRISGTGWEIVDPGRYYDTVIEVIDPASGELVAATRTDEFLYTFAGERLAVGQSLSDRVPRAHIRRLALRGR